MASNQPSSTGTASQTMPEEMRELAHRLRARAGSVLMKDQPHQAADLQQAASLIEQFVHLRDGIRRLADEVRDEVEEQHLRHLLGGA